MTPEKILGFERSDLGVLLFFTIVAAYMFYGSFEYRGIAAVYPRYIALSVLVLSVSLFLYVAVHSRNEANAVREHHAGFEDGPPTESAAVQSNEPTSEESLQDPNEEYSHMPKVVITLTGLYLGVSYLVGMLWATPVFTFTYLYVLNYPRWFSVKLSILAFVIAFAMYSIFGFPIDAGWVHEVFM